MFLLLTYQKQFQENIIIATILSIYIVQVSCTAVEIFMVELALKSF